MSDNEHNLAHARQRVQALRARLQARQAAPVALIETHISWVLLAADDAYKLKKPLRLPFVDFSSLESRRQSCNQELRLNRRLAPAIYREVVEVREGPDGPNFGGRGGIVDFAVLMRRFADGSLWSERLAAGTLAIGQIEGMAGCLARFHADAEVLPTSSRFATAAVHERVTRRLIDAENVSVQDKVGVPNFDWPRLRDWLSGQLRELQPLWVQRRQQGRIREGHGDLHLANLLQQGDESTAFDAIDFDPELRCIDVIEDIAFLVMDLLANHADAAAWRFLDLYLQASGDYAGLPALRFYLVRRALVRAQVRDLTGAAQAQGSCNASGYRALAYRLAVGVAPAWLAITHGLPASGKSFVAQRLLMDGAAIRLRSDVERKRLHEIAALESSKGVGDIYTEDATRLTYQRLHELARLALQAGWPVVVDAAFLRHAERQQFVALAGALGVRFCIVDCRAPLAVLEDRILQRLASADDASEADASVLAKLRAVEEPLTDQELALVIVVDAVDPAGASAVTNRWLANPPARS